MKRISHKAPNRSADGVELSDEDQAIIDEFFALLLEILRQSQRPESFDDLYGPG